MGNSSFVALPPHRLLTMFCAVLLIAMGGCGRSSPRYAFEESQHDQIANAFLVAVREYYAKRTDGTLSEPGLGDERVRFIYRYGMIINGQVAEEVRLDFCKRRVFNEDGERRLEPASFVIGAWYRREGPDPEIPAVREAIIGGMKEHGVVFAPAQ